MNREDLIKGLAHVLNCHSVDNSCNTPDFLLAEFLVEQLEAYQRVKVRNAAWHSPTGLNDDIGKNLSLLPEATTAVLTEENPPREVNKNG